MEHFILRCKHCHKEYTYCTYGNGPEFGTEEGCSKEYCAECQKAINDALNKIPVKYEGKMTPIDESDFDTINDTILKEKERYISEILDGVLSGVQIIPELGYKSVCGCYIDHVYYFKGVKENGEIDITYSGEYDLINHQLTGKKYQYYDKPCNQYIELCQCPPLGGKFGLELNPTGLSAPEGKLYYFDFENE